MIANNRLYIQPLQLSHRTDSFVYIQRIIRIGTGEHTAHHIEGIPGNQDTSIFAVEADMARCMPRRMQYDNAAAEGQNLTVTDKLIHGKSPGSKASAHVVPHGL